MKSSPLFKFFAFIMLAHQIFWLFMYGIIIQLAIEKATFFNPLIALLDIAMVLVYLDHHSPALQGGVVNSPPERGFQGECFPLEI